MTEPDRNPWNSHDGVPTLLPDANQPGTAGPGVPIGNFQLQSLLGRGGMGEVWKAWDTKAERPVVLKLVPPELQRAAEEMARVRATFQRIHALQHQHICPVYMLDEDPRLGWYLVMKFIDGQTLSSYRATYAARHGGFPVEQVVKVLRPVAEALDYAHRHKVIHRDVKPQNILVAGNSDDVQVVDFGLAAEIRTTVSRFTQVQMDTSGTRPYMAPEQWRGQFQDARTDQYALAVVAYELLAGHLPFESADFDILRACVLNDPAPAIFGQSETVNRTLLVGLGKQREERYSSCADFVGALVDLHAVLPPRAVEAKVVSKGPRPTLPECPECHTPNEPHRKFCCECAAPLVVQCLKCDTKVPVWEKVCPECGTVQAKALAARRQGLESQRAEAERLLGEYAFEKALKVASKLAAEPDHRLKHFKEWGEAFLVRVGEQMSREEEASRELFLEARRGRDAFDYLSAIKALESIPVALRTTEMSEFLGRLLAEQREADALINEIGERVERGELEGLLSQVSRAVELRGDLGELGRLKRELQEREARLVAEGDQAFSEARRLLEEGRVTEALQRTKEVESERLRPCDIQMKQHLSTLVEKEKTLAELVRRFNSDGVVDADEVLKLLDATLEYCGLNGRNAKANALREELMRRFVALPAEALARMPAGLIAKLPADVIVAKMPPDLVAYLVRKVPAISNSIGMELVLIPAGEFLMGAPPGEKGRSDHEGPQHLVRITKPFYLGLYPVTQGEYERVMGNNPSRFAGNPRRPVDSVSWENAVEFCRKLSEMEGREYRLPTEAEWEYACRAGSRTKWSFGNAESLLREYAWYADNSGGGTHPVGRKKPNAWGLYDMHGNVWEWCSDWYGEYTSAAVSDPSGDATGSYRVFRGGCWRRDAWDCRSADRIDVGPGKRGGTLGFRVASSSLDVSGK